ncbi:Ig-like domain-containing protein [Rubrivirga sp.]|uniref:Ig-like domain-containing protein n=1 Tax=Rubrivirga sp. TaxID=1885344 RepID=UPI003C77491C
MTRCFALLALVAMLAAPASAQLTFTIDDFYDFADSGETVVGTSFSTGDQVPSDDQAEIDALIALTGQGQTWDFTTIDYPVESTVAQTFYLDGDVAGLPGAANFPGANYAVLNDTTAVNGDGTAGYVYADVSDDQYVTQGIFVPAQGSTPETVIVYEPDGLQQLVFPIRFGSVSEDQTTQTIQGFTITTDFRTEVVGEGTLITPAGSAPALMIEYGTSVSTAGFTVSTDVYVWATGDPNIQTSATNFATPQGPRAYAASYITRGGGGQNQPPSVPATQTASARSGETTPIDVLEDVTDPDGDPLSITAVSDPANGTAEIGDDGTGRLRTPIVNYTPDAGFTGDDSFTFTVSDGTAEASGTVTVTVTGGVALEDELAVTTFSAFPNPATNALRLQLSTSRAGLVEVVLYDVLGREAAVAHRGTLGAGDHAFSLDTSDLAPGVYVARIDLEGASSTVRVTVAR